MLSAIFFYLFFGLFKYLPSCYNGKSGYGRTGEKENIEIVYSALTRLEVNKLNAEIEKMDLKAFVVMHRVKGTKKTSVEVIFEEFALSTNTAPSFFQCDFLFY
ncbi:MAG: DUF2179 domain-containing protein [Bacteroidetes bacterium]|nr:DUF2179 domain-containing protein [Bacteroidota bacterium]